MYNHALELSNGFRAWAAAALMFGFPALNAFLLYAFRRARLAWREEGRAKHKPLAYLLALKKAGAETNMHSNAWLGMSTLVFAGGAGGAIFISSNFLGGYGSLFLTMIMLPFWALIASIGWSVTIFTTRPENRNKMSVSAGMLLVSMLVVGLSLDGAI